MDLKEKKISSEHIFKGHLLDVYKDTVLCPNGKIAYRELIRHCLASCMIAKLDDGKFLLERQFRYPFDEVLYEFPAGKADGDEKPEVTASRELEEETGYRATKLVYLGKIYPSPAYTDEAIYLYYATSLEKKEQHLDKDEALNIYEVSFEEIEKLVDEDKIHDAKTLAAIYLYKRKILKK
jgi:ADP-ribose pyrophosphatase